MWGRRPRYDDTFGVRMDLGADRKDPLAVRPAARVVSPRVKAPVIVERPRSVFDLFRGREDDGLGPRPPRAARTVEAPMPQREAAAAPAPDLRAFEATARRMLSRLSLQQRLGFSVFAFWLLMATGLFVPAIIVVVIYLAVRRRSA